MTRSPDCFVTKINTRQHDAQRDVSTRDGGICRHLTRDTGDRCTYHKTTVSATSAPRHHAITLARFFGRSGGGLCRLARARNASATRWECDWIMPFQPGVSITSVAWLQTHKHTSFQHQSIFTATSFTHCLHASALLTNCQHSNVN